MEERTKVILVVHLAGNPSDMDAIMEALLKPSSTQAGITPENNASDNFLKSNKLIPGQV